MHVFTYIKFSLVGVLRSIALTIVGCSVLSELPAQTVSSGPAKPASGNFFAQLPPAKVKTVAAIQKFRYLTDQHKQLKSVQDRVKSSTDAMNDHTDVLARFLEESGWFTPIESGTITKLLHEARSRQLNGAQTTTPAKAASPDIILESGVLAYSSEVMSDEKAAQYFGEGNPKNYQQNRATIYLRVISIPSGRILKTIYATKTLFSQPTTTNLIRYVTFMAPLKAETGITPIEPGQLTVNEAIRQAVLGLIVEGVQDGLWSASDKSAAVMETAIATYEQQKRVATETDLTEGQPNKGLFGLRHRMNAPFISIQPYAGSMRYQGDYVNGTSKGTYGLSVEMFVTPAFGIQLNAATGTLASQDAFSVNLTSLEGNILIRPLPNQRLTPLLYGGFGIVSRSESKPFPLYGNKYGQIQGGIGLQFSPSRIVGVRTMLSLNQPFTDSLDGQTAGSRNDYYTRLTIGLVFHLGRFESIAEPITFTKVP